MARKLAGFPGSRRYPWEDWTDGSVWEIRQGVDYDVDTENMRTNLHIRASSHAQKVRTQRLADGDGLVFQFRDKEETKMDDGAAAAMDALYADCVLIYERAREEVSITRRDGTTQKYAAVRYKQAIDRARERGGLALRDKVSQIVREVTQGFGRLEDARRPDLMLETFVVDAVKPYHRFFSADTVRRAQERLDDYHRRTNEDS